MSREQPFLRREKFSSLFFHVLISLPQASQNLILFCLMMNTGWSSLTDQQCQSFSSDERQAFQFRYKQMNATYKQLSAAIRFKVCQEPQRYNIPAEWQNLSLYFLVKMGNHDFHQLVIRHFTHQPYQVLAQSNSPGFTPLI